MFDAILVDPVAIETRERMREMGRVPRRLTLIVVGLPEIPMGNEAGAHVAHEVPFDSAVADPGKLGALVRALTRTNADG